MKKELIIRLRNRDYLLLLLSFIMIMILEDLGWVSNPLSFIPVIITAVAIIAQALKRYNKAINTLDKEGSFASVLHAIDAYTKDKNASAYQARSPFVIKRLLTLSIVIGLLVLAFFTKSINVLSIQEAKNLSELSLAVSVLIILGPLFSLFKKECLFQLLKKQTKKEALKDSLFLYEEGTILYLIKTRGKVVVKDGDEVKSFLIDLMKNDQLLLSKANNGLLLSLLKPKKEDSVFYKELSEFVSIRNWSLIITTIILSVIMSFFLSQGTVIVLLVYNCLLLVSFKDYDELLSQTLLLLRARVLTRFVLGYDHSLMTHKPKDLSKKELTVRLWTRVSLVALLATPNVAFAIMSQNYYWLAAALLLLYLMIGILIMPVVFSKRFVESSVIIKGDHWTIKPTYKKKTDNTSDKQE